MSKPQQARQPRRIFNYDNAQETMIIYEPGQGYEKSIFAAGCLFYKFVNNEPYVLLIKYSDPKWTRLDDLGGRIDMTDVSLDAAIIREVREESNGVIDAETMRKLLNNPSTLTFYHKRGKYCLKMVKVDDSFYPDTTVFGKRELTDDIERTIAWYKYYDVVDNMAERLDIMLGVL